MRYMIAALLCIAVQAHAQTGQFTPDEGASIRQSPFTVSWESSAVEQWVRAYDVATGDKIYGSGRQKSRSGSVSIEVPRHVEDVQVIYYEKVDGAWMLYSRTYPVDIDYGVPPTDNSGSSVIISDRISCNADLIDYSVFDGEIDILLNGGITAECGLYCPEGEYLIAADCNAGWQTGSANLAYNAVVAELSYSSSGNSATCTSYAAKSIDPFGDDPGDGVEPIFGLTASGACMSLPD